MGSWLTVVLGIGFVIGAVPLWRRRDDPDAQRGARVGSELPFVGDRLTPIQMQCLSVLCVVIGAAIVAGGLAG